MYRSIYRTRTILVYLSSPFIEIYGILFEIVARELGPSATQYILDFSINDRFVQRYWNCREIFFFFFSRMISLFRVYFRISLNRAEARYRTILIRTFDKCMKSSCLQSNNFSRDKILPRIIIIRISLPPDRILVFENETERESDDNFEWERRRRNEDGWSMIRWLKSAIIVINSRTKSGVSNCENGLLISMLFG